MESKKTAHSWRFAAAAPPREVFAVMEQLLGTLPYRFEVVSSNTAHIVEAERKGFFGGWTQRVRSPRWVKCTTELVEVGTVVTVECSGGRAPLSRALQLVRLLSQGNRDHRTIYRERHFPIGQPVTLVASWAGMGYALLTAPRFNAPRGIKVLTATPMVVVGMEGQFCNVRLLDGTEGYIETDQLAPAPATALREAQEAVAQYG